MTSKELNKLLLNNFPELEKEYLEEVEWQESDDTGSHIVYGDVFSPYIVKCIEENELEKLSFIFDFIEKILHLEDEYAEDVISVSVLESIHYLLKENQDILSYMGTYSKKAIETF